MGSCCRALLAAAPLAALAAPGQLRERDSGTLAIARQGVVIGREEFSLREGRSNGRDGFTLTSRAIAGTGGEVALVTTIEFGPDSQPISAQLADPKGERRTFVSLSPRRITLRAITPTGESVREFRGAPALWLSDSLSFAAFALAPGVSRGRLTIVWPRETRVETVAAADRGVEPASAGSARPLRHLVLGAGESARHLWFEESGRLMKVEIPSTGLSAIRITP